MKELSKTQLIAINGGHDGAFYKYGKFVGRVIKGYLAVTSIGKILKL